MWTMQPEPPPTGDERALHDQNLPDFPERRSPSLRNPGFAEQINHVELDLHSATRLRPWWMEHALSACVLHRVLPKRRVTTSPASSPSIGFD